MLDILILALGVIIVGALLYSAFVVTTKSEAWECPAADVADEDTATESATEVQEKASALDFAHETRAGTHANFSRTATRDASQGGTVMRLRSHFPAAMLADDEPIPRFVFVLRDDNHDYEQTD